MIRGVSPGGAWRRYVASLADLRLTIEQSSLDYDFGSSGGRIVYLFDANVVGLFLNPVRESKHIPRVGLRAPASHLPATAMMTAEFLFSRRLSGQDGLPPYLTQAHAEDLANVVDRLESRIVEKRNLLTAARPMEDGPSSSTEVAAIVSAARRDRINGREAARRLNELVPHLAELLFDGPMSEARQFQRLVQEGLLRPLRLLPQATLGVLKPDGRVVRAWVALLRDELNRTASRPSNRPAAHEDRLSHPRSILRDAETLAQLQLLNDATESSARRVRHVLVTTDRVMMRAYTRWFYGQGDRTRDGYALRHPAQYVPILNAGQMGGSDRPPGLFDQVRDAIDGLFQTLRDGRPGYMRTLAGIADPRLAEADERRSLEEGIDVLRRVRRGVDDRAIRQVRGIWTEAAKGAVLLGTPLLQRHLAPAWDAVSAILEGEDGIRRGVLDHLDELLLDVEASHAGFLVGGFLDIHSDPSATPAPGRAPPLLRPWSPEIHAALDAPIPAAMASAGAERGQGATIAVAACIAFRVGRWESARHFCGRASEIVAAALRRAGGDERPALLREKHELRYLAAEIERHRPTGEHDQYLTLLKSSLEFYARTGDRFGSARTYLARAALGMGSILAGELNRDRRPGPDMPNALIDFVAAADDAAHCVKQALSLDPTVEPVAPRLVEEALLVYLTVAIYDVRVARTGGFDPERVEAACDTARTTARPAGSPRTPMLRLASDCALWSIGEGTQRLAAAGRVRRAVETDLRPATPSDRWLLDRVARRAAADVR